MGMLFECMILMETGTIIADGERIYPETKIVKSCNVLEESILFDDAKAKVIEIAKSIVAYRKDSEDKFEFYENRDAYAHDNIWIIKSWLPSGRMTYERIYAVLKNVSSNPVIKKCDW